MSEQAARKRRQAARNGGKPRGRARVSKPPEPAAPAQDPVPTAPAVTPGRTLVPYKIVGVLKAQVVNEDGRPVKEIDVAQIEVFEAMFDNFRDILDNEWWPDVLEAFAPAQLAAMADATGSPE